MSLQSAGLKAATSEIKAQDETLQKQDTPKNNEKDKKMENGYAVNSFYNKKQAIVVLSEVKPNNSVKKRKATVDEVAPDRDETSPTEQIKDEHDSMGENLENLSEYEKMCRKNIEQKMAFFASLNFDEAKRDFLAASSALKPGQKPRKRYNKKKVQLTSRRKSLRLQNINPEGKPLSELEVAEPMVEEHPHRTLTFDEVFKAEDQSSEEFVKDLSMLSREEFKFEAFSYSRYESYFQTMRINPALVTKVVSSRIYSVAVHPSKSKSLACAGSKYGHVSFWDIESKNPLGGVYVYEPHSRPVNCVAFNTSNPYQVISSSYDGTVRCGNLEAGVFDEVYYTGQDYKIRCSHFDFLSSDSLLVALSTGEVAVVDMRTPKHSNEVRHTTHPYSLKTVSVHPVQKDYFIAAGRNGIVSLWDLRSVQKKSVADMVLSRSVNSAYFSPVTGNSVLTTSMDHKLCLFDTTHLNGSVSLKKSISLFDTTHLNESASLKNSSHANLTWMWQKTPFQAVWLPNNEDAFFVGSTLQPPRIEVYTTIGVLAHNFCGEHFGSVCYINAFHPTKPLLVGANSTGKLYAFKGRE